MTHDHAVPCLLGIVLLLKGHALTLVACVMVMISMCIKIDVFRYITIVYT